MDALSPDDNPEDGVVVRYGVRKEITEMLRAQKRSVPIAQFWGLVEPGLIVARHVFQGLERGLYYEGDMNADRRFLVYTWRSVRDYRWDGDPYYGGLSEVRPPRDKVFCVLVYQYEQMDEEGVSGSIVSWNFVDEDKRTPEAPIDWENRYNRRFWSRT